MVDGKSTVHKLETPSREGVSVEEISDGSQKQ